VLDHAYVDESKLSSNTDKRDQFQEMLFDLRRRFKHINDRYKREKASREKPFGVIFWKSNRLGRDSIEATNIKTDLRLRGITIRPVTSTIQATPPLMRSSKSSSGRMSRHCEISQNAKSAAFVGARQRSGILNTIPIQNHRSHLGVMLGGFNWI
jgi:DNA invertase Pin-like site-specific DNA recombinase